MSYHNLCLLDIKVYLLSHCLIGFSIATRAHTGATYYQSSSQSKESITLISHGLPLHTRATNSMHWMEVIRQPHAVRRANHLCRWTKPSLYLSVRTTDHHRNFFPWISSRIMLQQGGCAGLIWGTGPTAKWGRIQLAWTITIFSDGSRMAGLWAYHTHRITCFCSRRYKW